MAKFFRKVHEYDSQYDNGEWPVLRLSVLGAGFLGLLGLQLWAGLDNRVVSLTAFALLLGVWGLIWHHVTRYGVKSYWIVLLMATAFSLAVAFPPATSKDANSYALYGRMTAVHGASPYTHTPVEFVADPWFPRTSAYWSDSPSVYGPVFTAASAGIVSVTGDSRRLTLLGFQLLELGALAGVTALAARRLGRTRAIAVIALNPLLLTFGVNDAHCDVLVGLGVLAGALALQREKLVAAGALFALAAMVKITAVAAIAGAFVWLLFRGASRSRTLISITRFISSALVIAVTTVWAAGGLDVLSPLRSATGRHTRFSAWNPVHSSFTNWMSAPAADNIVAVSAQIAFAAATLWLLWRHRRDTSTVLVVASGLVAYQLLGAYVLSWYAAWSLPLLSLLPRSRLFAVTLAHGCWVAMAYYSGFGVIAISILGLIFLLVRRDVALWLLSGNTQTART